jgi:hypothetical protein
MSSPAVGSGHDDPPVRSVSRPIRAAGTPASASSATGCRRRGPHRRRQAAPRGLRIAQKLLRGPSPASKHIVQAPPGSVRKGSTARHAPPAPPPLRETAPRQARARPPCPKPRRCSTDARRGRSRSHPSWPWPPAPEPPPPGPAAAPSLPSRPARPPRRLALHLGGEDHARAQGFVRISASPACPPASVTGARSRSPVTVNPTVSSAPIDECPPSTLAPAGGEDVMRRAHHLAQPRALQPRLQRGRMTVATADCGAAPIAQTSPSACTAATRATSAGSSAKARR